VGPGGGFSTFKLSSPILSGIHPKEAIGSLLGKKLFTYKFLKNCEVSPATGFYYYQILFPKKCVSMDENCMGLER
jgi:hypothetical protein